MIPHLAPKIASPTCLQLPVHTKALLYKVRDVYTTCISHLVDTHISHLIFMRITHLVLMCIAHMQNVWALTLHRTFECLSTAGIMFRSDYIVKGQHSILPHLAVFCFIMVSHSHETSLFQSVML